VVVCDIVLVVSCVVLFLSDLSEEELLDVGAAARDTGGAADDSDGFD